LSLLQSAPHVLLADAKAGSDSAIKMMAALVLILLGVIIV
jgi:hypothetical protein